MTEETELPLLLDSKAPKPKRKTKKAPVQIDVDPMDQFGPAIKREVLPDQGQEERAVAISPPTREVATAEAGGFGSDFLQTIERVACNPAVNPDVLEKLLDMQIRVMDRQARAAFNEAFVRMAPKLPQITKDGRIVAKGTSKASGREYEQNTPYANWETISPIIVPILSEHGFSIRHRTETAPDGKIRIVAIFYGHGHTEESYMDFELDTTGSKNNAQARVSASTYGRRTTASTVINLVTRGEDDDGKASGRPKTVGEPLTPAQLEELIEYGVAVECSAPRLIKHLNEHRPKGHPEMTALEDLPASRFGEAMDALKSLEANRLAAKR